MIKRSSTTVLDLTKKRASTPRKQNNDDDFFKFFFFLSKKSGKLLAWLMMKLRAFTGERMNISGHPGRLQRRESVRANVLEEEVQPDEVFSVEKLFPKVEK